MSLKYAVVCIRETKIKKIVPVSYINNFKTFKKYYPTETYFCYISNDITKDPVLDPDNYKSKYKEGDTGIFKVHILRFFGKLVSLLTVFAEKN